MLIVTVLAGANNRQTPV